MKEVSNILRILEETKEAIGSRNYAEIKNLSNQTVNIASLTQDPDNVAVSVVVYSLSQILEKPGYRKLPGWAKFYKTILSALDHSITDLKKNDLEDFRKDFETIRQNIGKLSGKLKDYIQEVFRKAQISKASKIYEHGISMEQTAKLLGITMYELAEYAGTKTEIPDAPESKTMNPNLRIKLAMGLFE